jgi:hypothetical protein
MSKQPPIAIKVKGRVYKLAKPRDKDWKENWREEYEDPEAAPAGVQLPDRRDHHQYRDPEAREFYKRIEMKENDPRWKALGSLFHALVRASFDRVLLHMNHGELTEEVQQQLADKLNNLDITFSMFDPWSKMDAQPIIKQLDEVETLTHDPDLFRFSKVHWLHPAGPIKLHDLVKEIANEGHLKNIGFTLGIDDDDDAQWHAKHGEAPKAVKVNGRVYRLADDGPLAPASDPKTMSPEAVLAADMGFSPDQMEEHKDTLQGLTNADGKSLYDFLRGARETD